jgi:hypothetical protein
VVVMSELLWAEILVSLLWIICGAVAFIGIAMLGK